MVGCRACPRLVEWREQVAATKRAAYADQLYWGRPVPSWGPADAALAILGLAPAAHGGNRTGRIFTGDRSGDWLFAALHRAGLAAIPTSVSADDDQRLHATRILAAVHCAPPDNKPTPAERDACRGWLVRDLELLAPTLRAVLVLGGFAWDALWPALRRRLRRAASPTHLRPRGELRRGLTVIGCYHPSQQNTFTGKLTAAMLDDVVERAASSYGRLRAPAPAHPRRRWRLRRPLHRPPPAEAGRRSDGHGGRAELVHDLPAVPARGRPGNLEPRHVVVPLRRVLNKCRIVSGRILRLAHARASRCWSRSKAPGVRLRHPRDVPRVDRADDAHPGPARHGIGFKSVGEATYLRNHVLAGWTRRPPPTTSSGAGP